MPTLSELKRKIRTDSLAYDKLAKQYNALIRKEQAAGHITTKGGKVTVVNTTAGKNAGRRIVESWNKVARKGKQLKTELEQYVAKTKAQPRRQTKRKVRRY